MTSLFSRLLRRLCHVAVAAAVLLGASTAAQANEPASFASFQVENYSGNYFLAWGYVEDDAPTECLIVFSGLLWGEFATPDETGYFEYEFILDPGRSGIVQALLYDPGWLYTDVAQEYVE